MHKNVIKLANQTIESQKIPKLRPLIHMNYDSVFNCIMTYSFFPQDPSHSVCRVESAQGIN